MQISSNLVNWTSIGIGLNLNFTHLDATGSMILGLNFNCTLLCSCKLYRILYSHYCLQWLFSKRFERLLSLNQLNLIQWFYMMDKDKILNLFIFYLSGFLTHTYWAKVFTLYLTTLIPRSSDAFNSRTLFL